MKADEATAPATEATTTDTATSDAAVATSSKLTSTTVTEGNKIVTTTYVESPELEKAKADAATEGVTVTEEAEKSPTIYHSSRKQINKSSKQLKSTQS